MPASCRPARRRRVGVGHVLTNYLGGPGGGGVAEVYRLDLADGDRLLVCTDGLTDLVGDDEIGRGPGPPPRARRCLPRPRRPGPGAGRPG